MPTKPRRRTLGASPALELITTSRAGYRRAAAEAETGRCAVAVRALWEAGRDEGESRAHFVETTKAAPLHADRDRALLAVVKFCKR